MRHAIAVERLRAIATRCQQAAGLWDDEPVLTAVYVFGDVVEGRDSLDFVEVALVINQPPAEVPLGARPEPYLGLAKLLEVAKPWVMWYLRPAVWPVSNHRIRSPLRIWSVEGGPDTDALEAVARGDAGPLRQPAPDAADASDQLAEELACSLAQLGNVVERYWDRDWRSEHRGNGVYPEHHLWEAVSTYLDLLDASQTLASRASVNRPGLGGTGTGVDHQD